MKDILALSALVVGALVSQVHAEEAPLHCSANTLLVECDVQANEAVVTDAIFNQGNCVSPIATEEQKRMVKEYTKNLPESDQAAIAESPLGFVIDLRQQGKGDLADAIVLSSADPIGSHKSGDKITIFNTCENLTEYTITVNGQEWTWHTSEQ